MLFYFCIMYEHQDWTEVTFKKSQPKKDYTSSVSFESKTIKSLESDELNTISKVSSELAQAIIAGRLAKRLTQQQLAAKVALSTKIINEIENKRAQYIPCQIAKIAKELNISTREIKKTSS